MMNRLRYIGDEVSIKSRIMVLLSCFDHFFVCMDVALLELIAIVM